MERNDQQIFHLIQTGSLVMLQRVFLFRIMLADLSAAPLVDLSAAPIHMSQFCSGPHQL